MNVLCAIHWSGLLTDPSASINRWLFHWPLESLTKFSPKFGPTNMLILEHCYKGPIRFKVQFCCSGIAIRRSAGHKSGASTKTETYSPDRSMAHSLSNLCSDLYGVVSEQCTSLNKTQRDSAGPGSQERSLALLWWEFPLSATKTLFPWDQVHWQLWLQVHHMNRTTPAVSLESSHKNSRQPFPAGFCWKFLRGDKSSGCNFKHWGLCVQATRPKLHPLGDCVPFPSLEKWVNELVVKTTSIGQIMIELPIHYGYKSYCYSSARACAYQPVHQKSQSACSLPLAAIIEIPSKALQCQWHLRCFQNRPQNRQQWYHWGRNISFANIGRILPRCDRTWH